MSFFSPGLLRRVACGIGRPRQPDQPAAPPRQNGRHPRTLRAHLLLALVLLASQAGASAAEPAGAAPGAAGKIGLQWYGQSAVRIRSPGGKIILIDPYLTENPKTPARYKNLDTLGPIDLILVTHAHPDHLGDAPALALSRNAPIIAPAGLASSLAALGIVPPELAPRMNKGGTVMPLGPGIRVTMVHAEHSSELIWKNPATGRNEVHVGGEPVGFIVELENGFRIYHMGDTALFSDLRLIGERYHPDLVLAPIGGHFVMDPADAAFAIREWLKPAYVLPIHYGTFPVLKGTPEQFRAALGESRTKVLALEPGQSLELY
jgi:L-ascorbate metabolism protein UlaG (beta-lactamase superfamily)